LWQIVACRYERPDCPGGNGNDDGGVVGVGRVGANPGGREMITTDKMKIRGI